MLEIRDDDGFLGISRMLLFAGVGNAGRDVVDATLGDVGRACISPTVKKWVSIHG